MTYTETTNHASTSTITAFFDERSEAEHAVSRLVDAGVSRDSVTIVAGENGAGTDASSTEHKGFWETLGDFFFSDDDRHVYAEGIRRGGYLVTVTGHGSAHHDRILDILDDEGSIDLDNRVEAWEAEGWSRTASAAATSTAGYTGTRASAGTTSTLEADGEEVIPVVEEELRVGKRDVNAGRVRVRSYTREIPVSESVSLRDENVQVTRRTVDRPVTGTENAFVDRTIEAEEHREEAVISKEARVVEEIELRKTAEQREQTVTDTIRKTEIEVDDSRTDGTVGFRKD
ncbi:hypothetical protein ASG25_09380 [Rhizobium sp. Leaf384]|uniref:YsnF/AvaK domain-containing protein n=1 Tax=Rhizobium sp. Leaf384 TaxID=1736358 RepID=UPI00071396E5|nr:YsnF/AvaK domain-containing protein [Rhizobium sp. Leaf384]KQS78835.1 hypothetical protein ASG25_09380 [Rhizobium sp. Leaf384]